jgi:antitoxin (DNA-binding transcriptional repressor) of toxin-antitoxin stability system
MREVSLREFRTRGANALKTVPQGETVLLAGRQGPAYFLVPVFGDVATEERELRRAVAKASLRKSWRIAEQAGLNSMSGAEIDAEIASMRRDRRRRKTK